MTNSNDIVSILNEKLDKLFPNGDLSSPYLLPIKFKDWDTYDGGVTICPLNKDAFTLNPPFSGGMVTYRPSGQPCKERAIVRYIIGYKSAVEMAHDDVFFNFNIPLVINDMLGQLISLVGSSKTRKLTLKRPIGSYFMESENFAGYELRIFMKEEQENAE